MRGTKLSCSKLRSCVELSEIIELSSFAALSFSSSSFPSSEASKQARIPVWRSSSRSAIEDWWQASGSSCCRCCRCLGCCSFFTSASIVGKHPSRSSNKLLRVDLRQVSRVGASFRGGIVTASDEHALSFRDVTPSTSLRKSDNEIFKEIAVFLSHFEEEIARPYLRQVRFETKATRSHSLSGQTLVVLEHHAERLLVVDEGLDFVDDRDEEIRQEVVCRRDLLRENMEERRSDGTVADRRVESETLSEGSLVNKQVVVETAAGDSVAVHGVVLRIANGRRAFLPLTEWHVHWTGDVLRGEPVVY